MFRTDPNHPFRGPHQDGETLTAGAEQDRADRAMILIHGRGASAEGILRLADELDESELHYVAPQAAGNSWYPYSFLQPVEQNQPGLSSALQVIRDLLTGLEGAGIDRKEVILAGFSQGACLVSEYAARHPARYGGVVVLSGGLIGQTLPLNEYRGEMEGTPVFLGCSDVDPHIPLERVDQTADLFGSLGADVTRKIYPGMPHTVNKDELDQVKRMIRAVNKE